MDISNIGDKISSAVNRAKDVAGDMLTIATPNTLGATIQCIKDIPEDGLQAFSPDNFGEHMQEEVKKDADALRDMADYLSPNDSDDN